MARSYAYRVMALVRGTFFRRWRSRRARSPSCLIKPWRVTSFCQTKSIGGISMNRCACAAALMMVAVSFTIAAQEKKIEQSSLPAAVQKAVQEQSQVATLKGYATEVEHGKKVYEAEMIVNGHTKDLQIAADGA